MRTVILKRLSCFAESCRNESIFNIAETSQLHSLRQDNSWEIKFILKMIIPGNGKHKMPEFETLELLTR